MSAENNYPENTNSVIDQLTLEEKVALCSGLNEWDTKEIEKNGSVLVPSVKVADGPHGLRKTVGQGDNLGLAQSYPATCFPAESLLACSFDRELAKEMGASIAEEARQEGVCTILGPGANMKRNPLCGRNFEYLSEDPFLAGRMAAAYIEGAQSQGIGTSLKHFACNSQEYYRMTSDSRMDERTLREIYLSAFEYAVKNGKPATVMCAYNKINGISCSDNEFLLNHILREEWGYEGMVVSDWGALNDRIQAFRAGCDLIMPGGSAFEEEDVIAAVKEGILDEKYVDRCAERVARFALIRRSLLEDNSGSGRENGFSSEELHDRSHQTAQKIAEQSAVLLKNEDNLLPIEKISCSSVCVIGSMAETFRFQGSGSSKINPTRRESFLKLINQRMENTDISDCGEELEERKSIAYARGYEENGSTTDPLLQEAILLAKKADKVILFAGLPETYEAEGIDRRTMSLPDGQNRLIEAVASVNSNVIVVLICGCVVETPWEPLVKSILWMGLSGQAGPKSLLRLLTGEVNPSGKLAESWPKRYEDCPSADCYLREGRDAVYREGIFIGYRYYDKNEIPVRFPFGHGLSYTRFQYSNLRYDYLGMGEKENHYRIQVNVKNVGEVSGSEAVLLFVEMPQDGIPRPRRELKGFEKVHLEPGEETVVVFETDERTFSVWKNGWINFCGEYGISVGSCSVKMMLSGTFFHGVQQSEAFEKSIQQTVNVESVKYSKNSTIAEVAQDVWILRVIYRWFERKQAKIFGRDSAEYLAAMSSANECPLRTVQIFLGLKNHFAQAIADFGNRQYVEGIRHLFR